MDTPAVRNQNPGNLKDPATGTFRSFSDPIEGKAALYNNLTSKMTGSSTTGIHGGSSLIEFAKNYAPASDKNDPIQYAANLANKLGVSPDTQIGTLKSRIDDFASAVASNEDPSVTYKATSPVQTQPGAPQQQMAGYDTSVEGIPEAPAPSTTEQPGMIENFIKKSALPAIGGFFKGAAKQVAGDLQGIGNLVAKPLGKAYGIPESQIGIPEEKLKAKGTAEKVGKVAGFIGEILVPFGMGTKATKAALAAREGLGYPGVKTLLQEILNPGEKLARLSTDNASIRLTNYLREMPISEIGSKLNINVIKALKQLNPALVEASPSVASKILGIPVNFLKTLGWMTLGAVGAKTIGSSISKFKSGLIP